MGVMASHDPEAGAGAGRVLIPDLVDNILAETLRGKGIFFAEQSKTFRKRRLIVGHNQAAEEYMRLTSGQGRHSLATPSSHLVRDPSEPSPPLSSLQGRTSIPAAWQWQREHDLTGKGWYIVGKFCVQPFMTGGVRTVFEDQLGHAVLVVIDNAMGPAASKMDVRNMYPEGMAVAIKEPRLEELWNDGTVGWKVGNPADIVPILERRLIQEAAKVYKSAEDGSKWRRLMLDCAERLSVAGNARFALGEWNRASVLYSLSVQALEKVGPTYRGHDSMKLITVYGKHLESCLLLGSYREALKSADKLLALLPHEEAVSLERARCLCVMHRYEEAISCLDLLEARTLDEKFLRKVSAMRVSVATACLQSRSGVYKFDDFVEIFLQKKEAPECSQYVGPVEIRRASCGRGMFATRDVRPGELLLVSKALARPSEESITHGRALDCCPGLLFYGPPGGDQPNEPVDTWPSDCQDAVVQMVGKALNSPKYARQVQSLHDGSQVRRDVPPLTLFTEDWDDDDNIHAITNPGKEEEHVQTIRIGHLRNVHEANSIGGAVYGTASFFNHSCIPNCMNYPVGDYLFVSSTRSIREGDELFVSYFPTTNSLQLRQRQAWPLFVCECPRCKFEKQVLKNTPALQELMDEYDEEFATRRAIMKTPSRAATFVGDLERILKSDDCAQLSDQQKYWIRCSFTEAHVLLCCQQITQGNLSTVDSTLNILDSVDQGNPCILALLALSVEEELNGAGGAGGNHFTELLQETSKHIYLPVEEKDLHLMMDWAKMCRLSLIRLLV